MSTNAKTTPKPAPRRRASGRKSERNASLTSERIAADLTAFRKDGGKIEVLGNTKVFKSFGPMATSKKAAKKAPAAAKKRA